MIRVTTNRMRLRCWKPIVKYNIRQHLTAKQLKQRNTIFKANLCVYDAAYARYSWATPAQIIKAMRLGYLNPNDRHNASPIQLRLLNFALQNKGKARFYYSGYMHSTAGREEIMIDTFIMVPFKKYRDAMISRFTAFCQTCDDLTIADGYISAWWD